MNPRICSREIISSNGRIGNVISLTLPLFRLTLACPEAQRTTPAFLYEHRCPFAPHRPPTPGILRALKVAIKVLVRTNRFEIDQADFVIDGVAQQVKLVGAAEFLEE